jgi:FdhD protein
LRAGLPPVARCGAKTLGYNRAEEAPINLRTQIERIEDGSRQTRDDQLAVEEPLEIRLDGKSLAVIMRSPGNDEELAAGFLYTEAIIKSGEELLSVTHRHDPKNPDLANVVDAVTTEGIDVSKRGWQRNFVSASSCGLCGKLTIESVRLQVPSVRRDKLAVTSELLLSLPEKMRAEQAGFDETGGIHAAGLFDADGNLLVVREDIGRHNAVDKVVGAAVLAGETPLSGRILMVSGRASFEIVQKALMARIPLVAAVSAASSLAVELADSCSMGLVGFMREDALNVYAGGYRIKGA